MGILQDEFLRALRDVLSSTSTKLEVLRFALERHGCSLSDDQLQLVIQAIEEGTDNVDLPVVGATQSISIGPDDIDQAIGELEKKLSADAEQTINRIVERLAPEILKSLYDALPAALREWHAAQRGFEKRLRRRWKTGLDRLEMLINIAHEAGETYSEDLVGDVLEDDDSPQEPELIEVLTALHCRACRTAREILCLLKGGYADGAHARWRSLHELAVTAFFLIEQRGDTPKRYLDHAAVERWRAAKEYQQHCHFLGYEPHSADELAEFENESNAAINRYGSPFKEDYGWAAQALSVPRPTFAQIEGSIQMSHWRPFFRLACQNVHAGSRGLFFSLGLPANSNETLLAGTSDSGLAGPGHQMAISLTATTIAFLTTKPNLDGIVTCHCLLKLCDDIGRELMCGHDFLNSADSSSNSN